MLPHFSSHWHDPEILSEELPNCFSMNFIGKYENNFYPNFFLRSFVVELFHRGQVFCSTHPTYMFTFKVQIHQEFRASALSLILSLQNISYSYSSQRLNIIVPTALVPEQQSHLLLKRQILCLCSPHEESTYPTLFGPFMSLFLHFHQLDQRSDSRIVYGICLLPLYADWVKSHSNRSGDKVAWGKWDMSRDKSNKRRKRKEHKAG